MLLSHLVKSEYISLEHFINHKPLIYEVCLFLKRIFYWIRHVDHARIFLPSLAALKSEISSWRKKIRRAKHSCVELFLNKFTGTAILKNTNLIKLFKYYTGTNLCNSTFVFRYTVRYTTIYCIPETYLNKDNRKFVKSFHPILGFMLDEKFQRNSEKISHCYLYWSQFFLRSESAEQDFKWFLAQKRPLIGWPIWSTNWRLVFWLETSWTRVLTEISEKTDFRYLYDIVFSIFHFIL